MYRNLFASLMILSLVVGCTANQRARNFGGTEHINVPNGYKVVNATWKETQLCYLVTPMTEGDVPKTSRLIEKSSFGIVEGEVVFVESN